MKFIFDEKKEIEDLMDCMTLNVSRFANIINNLSRYNFFVLGMDNNENVEIISHWLTIHCPKYNDFSYSSIVESYVKNASNYPLKSIQNIKIYQSELDYISNFTDIKKEKVLFVLLCVAKYQKEFFGYKNGKYICSTPDIFKMARVNIPVAEREMMMHELYGPIGCSYRVDGAERYVTFMSDGENNEKVAFEMDETDYLELAFKYLWWKNGKIGYSKCKKCGRLFRLNKENGQLSNKNSNARQYCHECSKREKMDFKTIMCVNCGKEVKILPKDTRTCMCEECYKEHRKQNIKENVQRYRDKM